MVVRGSVIQLKGRWAGAFAIVGKVEDWGVKASMLMPGVDDKVGLAPMRLKHDEYHDLDVIAPIIPSEVYGLGEE